MGLLLLVVKLLKPKLAHKTLLASLLKSFDFRSSANKSRRFRKLDIRPKFQHSRINMARYFLSRISLRINPGPIGVILIPSPTHRLANSQKRLETIDLDILILTPRILIRLQYSRATSSLQMTMSSPRIA